MLKKNRLGRAVRREPRLRAVSRSRKCFSFDAGPVKTKSWSAAAKTSRNFLHRHLLVKVMPVCDRQVRNCLYLSPDSRLGCRTTAIERQTDTDAGSFARFARHHDRASLQVDEATHDREAKTGSVILPVRQGFGLKERLAEPGEVASGDPDARIGHQDQKRIGFGSRTDCDAPSSGRELDRI